MSDILYANLTVQDRSKRKPITYVIEKQPFVKRKDNILHYSNVRDRRLINKTGASNDLHIVRVEVIKVIGQSQVY
jgi:hypothetical protein